MARTSGAIGMPTQTGTHALVVGWSNRKLSGFYGGIRPVKSTKYGCPNDPLAKSLTQTGWPNIFGAAGSNQSDAIVPLSSQLNTSTPNPDPNLGSQFTGYVHSVGAEKLNFKGPSVLDPDVVPPKTISIPQTVINLLNTPVTNQTAFSPVNP